MKTEYYNNFCFILLKRIDRNIVKEIFMGIIVSVLLILVYNIGILWGNLLVLFYCVILLITCVVENDTFFSYGDLKLFDIKINNLQFKITYILQRILIDMFVSNTIIVISIFLYLSINSGFQTAIFFLTIVIMSHCLMPSYNYWAYKIGDQGVIASVLALVITFVLIVVGCIHNVDPIHWLFSANSYLNSLLLILFSILFIIILDFSSKHYKPKVNGSFNTRFFFLWLKQIDVFLFKDYVLFYKNLLLNLIMILTLYSLLIMGTEEKLIPFMVAFIVGSSNILAVKSKKKYTLISEDWFFSESVLKKDIKKIRIKKLITILSGAFIKISLCFGMLFYHGIIDLMILSLLAVIMVFGSIIEFVIIYKNRMISTIMNKFLVYTAVVIFAISTYFEAFYIHVWVYLSILIVYSLIITVEILSKGKSENQLSNEIITRNDKKEGRNKYEGYHV